jgi:ankyrin repeat protein
MNRAAESGNIECAKILLEYNADIDALNFNGHTAFHMVINYIL